MLIEIFVSNLRKLTAKYWPPPSLTAKVREVIQKSHYDGPQAICKDEQLWEILIILGIRFQVLLESFDLNCETKGIASFDSYQKWVTICNQRVSSL